MATIVQNYGPIYGEVVNGTVQGRPNGSVYVPISNTISIITSADSISFIDSDAFKFNVSGKNAVVVAASQDLANYIVNEIYQDAELTTLLARRSEAAGNFNINYYSRTYAVKVGETVPEYGDTVYVRSVLCASGGDPVAVSTAIALTVVVPS